MLSGPKLVSMLLLAVVAVVAVLLVLLLMPMLLAPLTCRDSRS